MLNRTMKKMLVAIMSGMLVVSTAMIELPVYATQLEDVTTEETTEAEDTTEETEDITVSGGDAEVEDTTVSDGDAGSEDDETTDEEESTEDEKPFKKFRQWWKKFMKKLPFINTMPKPEDATVSGGDAIVSGGDVVGDGTANDDNMVDVEMPRPEKPMPEDVPQDDAKPEQQVKPDLGDAPTQNEIPQTQGNHHGGNKQTQQQQSQGGASQGNHGNKGGHSGRK